MEQFPLFEILIFEIKTRSPLAKNNRTLYFIVMERFLLYLLNPKIINSEVRNIAIYKIYPPPTHTKKKIIKHEALLLTGPLTKFRYQNCNRLFL